MRKKIKTFNAQAVSDGDGVKIHRLSTAMLQGVMNPYLMIDEINSDEAANYIGGFPMHPHRGFETITYMKAGRMRHRDHMGNEGVIGPGDVQWMSAARGVLHSEMPEQEEGLLHGFQIWLNLPAKEKMQAAAYRDIACADIAEKTLTGGGEVRVIAGEVRVEEATLTGPLPERSSEPVFIDLQLQPNESTTLFFNQGNLALVYVYRGEVDGASCRQLGFYAAGKGLHLTAGASGTEVLILSGKAINEPIVQYGPFVMNTKKEIEQAITDFQNNRFL